MTGIPRRTTCLVVLFGAVTAFVGACGSGGPVVTEPQAKDLHEVKLATTPAQSDLVTDEQCPAHCCGIAPDGTSDGLSADMDVPQDYGDSPLCSTVCSPELVPIPEGEFWMGCNQHLDKWCSPPSEVDLPGLGDELPYHKVITEEYGIFETEVTVGHYRQCVEEGCCSAPAVGGSECLHSTYGKEDAQDYPVNCVTPNQAAEYCEWACDGCRLCSAAEWEKAARGGCELYDDCEKESFVYPWGTADEDICEPWLVVSWDCHCDEYFCPVGSSDPLGRSPYGLWDMAGNVSELVADCYHTNYKGAPSVGWPPWTDECDFGEVTYVVRGANVFVGTVPGWPPAAQFAVSRRSFLATLTGIGSSEIGFRCCRGGVD